MPKFAGLYFSKMVKVFKKYSVVYGNVIATATCYCLTLPLSKGSVVNSTSQF